MSTIILKRSVTPGAVPTTGQLVSGEVAINTADSKLFHKNAAGTVVEIGGGSTTVSDGVKGQITVSSSGTVWNVTEPELAAIAGLTSAANKVPYFTGSGTAAVADLSAYARTILDDTSGAAMFTTMGASQTLSGSGMCNFPNGLQLRWGTAVVTADANGLITVPYGTAFTTGTFQFMVMNGDSANSAGAIFSTYTTGWPTSAGFVALLVNGAGAPLVGVTLRVTYFAIGN